jgi:hypothetical protein
MPGESYLIALAFGESDDLGVLQMITDDACELIERYWRVVATPLVGFDRLQAVAQAILDEHYPPDIFGTADAPDSDASDPGVRLVRALRACIAAEAK